MTTPMEEEKEYFKGGFFFFQGKFLPLWIHWQSFQQDRAWVTSSRYRSIFLNFHCWFLLSLFLAYRCCPNVSTQFSWLLPYDFFLLGNLYILCGFSFHWYEEVIHCYGEAISLVSVNSTSQFQLPIEPYLYVISHW